MNSFSRTLLILCPVSFFSWAEDKALEPFLPDDKDVIRHEYYDVQYDLKHQNPRWTIYRLEDSNLVDKAKRGHRGFVPDPDVEGSPTKLRFKGYDAGHMVPADDMEFDPIAIQETFYTTNACPQTARLNRGNWKVLENKCRELAEDGHRLIVVSGPVDCGAAAPDVYFKVVYDLDSRERFIWLSSEKGNRTATLDEVSRLTGIGFKR